MKYISRLLAPLCATLFIAGCTMPDLTSLAPTVPTYRQTDVIQNGPWQVTFTSVAWADTLMPYKMPANVPEQYRQSFVARTAKHPQEGARFLVVSMRWRNMGSVAGAPAPVPVFSLTNQNGAEYACGGQQLSMDDFSGKVILGQATANPGMYVDGVAVFEVPPGTYTLHINNGAWAGGWNYRAGRPVCNVVLAPTEEPRS